MTALRFDGVRFGYAGSAWTLSIPALCLGGERVTCIIGPNGSGKSTLMRLAAGLLRPDDGGGVTLDGAPLGALPRRVVARRIGFLPQESPPLFDYTVETVTAMGRYAYGRGLGLPTEADRRAVDEALAAVGLTALRGRPLSHLSGGERRRALVGSVLAQQPDILLLDEPTSALDIHHAIGLMRLLARFNGAGPAVVAVTHDINLAAMYAARVLLLVNGAVLADGPPARVIRPDCMEAAYGRDVLVREHPETGAPMVVARG